MCVCVCVCVCACVCEGVPRQCVHVFTSVPGVFLNILAWTSRSQSVRGFYYLGFAFFEIQIPVHWGFDVVFGALGTVVGPVLLMSEGLFSSFKPNQTKNVMSPRYNVSIFVV